MKKTREYYVCDICGAEAPGQIIYRGYDQTREYATSPIDWTKGFNVDVDICPRCSAALETYKVAEVCKVKTCKCREGE